MVVLSRLWTCCAEVLYRDFRVTLDPVDRTNRPTIVRETRIDIRILATYKKEPESERITRGNKKSFPFIRLTAFSHNRLEERPRKREGTTHVGRPLAVGERASFHRCRRRRRRRSL